MDKKIDIKTVENAIKYLKEMKETRYLPNLEQIDLKVKNNKCYLFLEQVIVLNNILECKNVLPTQDGFFFGSSDYDLYYIENIKSTY